MTETDFFHKTVLLSQAVAAVCPKPDGVYVDTTLGGGGHARELLRQSAPSGLVLGIDQDQTALRYASEWGRAFGDRLIIAHANFRRVDEVLAQFGMSTVDGIVCDLGVSSPQLDESERGFSYQADAPLDMRMDRDLPFTAADLVNSASARELTRILRDYGEERWASRIAEFMVERRAIEPLRLTGQLVDLVKAAIPASARRSGPHPAKRTFQALRIAVNDELGALSDFLARVPNTLRKGGRVAILSFHSLEDRMVKRSFADGAKGCICPPNLPVCACGREPVWRLISKKPITPDERELAANPRSRSAKLRVAERI